MRNRLVLMMWTAGRSADAEPMSRTRRQPADLLVPESRWRSMAACRSADPDLFFPISSSGQSMAQEAAAKAICAGCRVRRECLAFALRTHQAHGVWGGLSEQERHPVRSAALARVKRGHAAQVDPVDAPDLRDDRGHA
jgi:WhiB family redox-sensing transcriptional regulator